MRVGGTVCVLIVIISHLRHTHISSCALGRTREFYLAVNKYASALARERVTAL
jgi:hypothetical protein